MILTSPKHVYNNCPTEVNTCADSLKFLFRSDQNLDVKSAVCPCKLPHASLMQTCQVTRPLAINNFIQRFQKKKKNGQVRSKNGKSCLNHLLYFHVTAGNFAKFTDFAVISAKRGFCAQLLLHQIHAASC